MYAVLLGVSMAACLSQNDNETEGAEAPTLKDMPADADGAVEAPLLPEPANFVVEKGHVGDVRIGMPVEAMRQDVPMGMVIADTTLTQEGQQSTAYRLYPEGDAQGLLIEQTCAAEVCRVWRITVESPDYKTPKGIRVGSTYSEVQQAYPISSVTFEEGNLVAVAEDAGMSFILDTSQLEASKLSSFTAATLPPATLVESILVY